MTQIKMTFDPVIAKEFGTDAAIILSNIEFWQSTNEANKINFHDGVYWTYNSVEAFNILFNYLSYGQIRRCLEKLVEKGILLVGNYNKSSYDRTKWYASSRLVNYTKSICENQNIHLSELANGIDQNDKPIPNDKHNIKPNDNNINTSKIEKLPLEAKKENKEIKNKEIPTLKEFGEFALSKQSDFDLPIDKKKVKLKYDAWFENGWKDGNDKKITNWKSKLINSLQYLLTDQKETKPETSLRSKAL